jgi:transcriptional regulator with XRE-family HTH domain
VIRLPDDGRIGPALRGIRRMHRLTQKQLAADSGLWPSQLAHWERGDRQPDLASLIKLAAGLGYDLALIPREDAE